MKRILPKLNEIIRYSRDMQVADFDSREKIKAEYDFYITNWELDNGLFKSLPADFTLDKNEVCIYKLDSCELMERKSVTKKIITEECRTE